MLIKKFNIFKESFMDEKSPGEILQYHLRDFNGKKSNLQNLIIGNATTGKDISKNYEDIVKDNPFLRQYGSLLNIEASILRKEQKMKDTEESINKLNDDMKLVSKLSNEDDITSQTSNLEDQINVDKDTIKEDENDIKELKDKFIEKQIELKDFISKKGMEIEDIKKNSII